MFQSNRLLADSLGLVMVNFYLLKNKKRTKIPALVKCTDSSCFICCHFLFHSSSHSEVCLFWDPGQPKSEGQGGRRDEYLSNLKVRVTVTFSFLLRVETDSALLHVSASSPRPSAAGHTKTLASASAPALPM